MEWLRAARRRTLDRRGFLDGQARALPIGAYIDFAADVRQKIVQGQTIEHGAGPLRGRAGVIPPSRVIVLEASCTHVSICASAEICMSEKKSPQESMQDW